MCAQPVLVVHGVANRSEKFFKSQAAALQKGLGSKFDLIPAWWGDLGAPAEHILRTTPAGAEVQVYETRGGADGTTDEEAELIFQAAVAGENGGREVRSHDDDALRQEIAEAWAEVRDRQPEWTAEELAAIGAGVAEALADEAPAGRYEVRGATSQKSGVVKNILQGIAAAWTSFKGATLGGMQQDFRGKHLKLLTEFLGDIIVYQRHRGQVQAKVRQALSDYIATNKITEPLGAAECPLPVIGHSLGGVIAFDMAVAGEPPLHISKFVTLGSQPAFFHVVDPRDDQVPPRIPPYLGGDRIPLPATIGNWVNFWEPLDPFAFVADGIFDGDFDVPVDHRPDSGLYTHSDYWTNKKVQQQIKMFLA